MAMVVIIITIIIIRPGEVRAANWIMRERERSANEQ